MRGLKPLIPRKQREERQIEFVTNQHCNFRCFGCDSFSDIIKTPNFDNLVKEDIVNWSKVLVPLSSQSLINCKKVVPISSYEFKQIAKRPNFSVLSNKNLKKYIDYSIKNWLDEHELIYK